MGEDEDQIKRSEKKSEGNKRGRDTGSIRRLLPPNLLLVSSLKSGSLSSPLTSFPSMGVRSSHLE